MSLIQRDYDNIRLTSFIRSVPQRTAAILNRFMPDTQVRTRSYKIREAQRGDGAAPFRAFDTPAPIAPRVGYTERTGSLPPISESMILGEDETLGLFERVESGAFDDEVTRAVDDDAVILVQRLRNRMEQARGQVLSTGKFTVSGENGLFLEADFGVPVGNFVAPAGDLWTVTATADPIADLRAAQEQSLDDHGTRIRYAVMSPARVSNLLQNDSMLSLLAANGVTPGIATVGQINALFAAHLLPEIVEYDYRVDGVPTMAADKVVLLPEPDGNGFGRTEWGLTAEALKLDLDFNDQPGIVGYMMTSENPVSTKTQVTALGMPVLNDPTRLYVLDVA